MIDYILIANTSQPTINYTALVGALLLLLAGVLIFRHLARNTRRKTPENDGSLCDDNCGACGDHEPGHGCLNPTVQIIRHLMAVGIIPQASKGGHL